MKMDSILFLLKKYLIKQVLSLFYIKYVEDKFVLAISNIKNNFEINVS